MKLAAITMAILMAPLIMTGCNSNPNSNPATSTKPPATAEATASSIPPVSSVSSASEGLSIELVKHDKGFSFPLQFSEGVNGFVAQTFPVPNDPNLVAHLVKRKVHDPEGIRYRLDVVAVKPKEQTCSFYPVADIVVKDDYSIDSITGAYGFTKQDQLVLVRPKKRDNGQEGIQYDVAALDLHTGRMKTIAANAVPDVSPSFYARGWMNKSGQLYLNSYSDGRLWSVDVHSGEVQTMGEQFKNEWPLYLLYASPDGHLFWHEETDNFRLYDRNGKELKVIPPTLGYHSYPAFEWSPDSRFAALAFTLSDSHDNILGGEDAYIIAPEAVAFYDEKGDLTWDVQAKPKEGLTHVDWNGWLANGDEGVLSWYRLDRSKEGAPRKADLSYALANVTTGKITELAQAAKLEDLKKPMPVVGSRMTSVLFIDREEGLYWMPEKAAQADSSLGYKLLSKPSDAQLIWSAYDYGSEQATITRYNPVNHATSITVFNEPLGDELQLIDDTLIVDNKMNYRWIH